MRLVSDNPNLERDKEVEWVKDGLRWHLRELAANLMRITRGAGKPHEVGSQVVEVLQVLNDYREVVGAYPTAWEIQNALALDDSTLRWGRWDYAMHGMVKGGLQMAASELLGQRTQISRGERELLDGLDVIERIRDENRRGIRRPPKFTERNQDD
ncbi:hypothetical protein [Altererythrobacter sp. Root672]|uniref:hypothetical protein n=1 Tax=Altererythrobacter sp. Root672 TaxID=1736584 RepID=UPI000724F7A1|nr:hypothetical protein [Altererythrobacter sp. Root672]KRA80308.1 hypothetical protein ASD76_14085 [Altererythrobacter sp. Root672]